MEPISREVFFDRFYCKALDSISVLNGISYVKVILLLKKLHNVNGELLLYDNW